MPPKVGEITINFIPRNTPLRSIEPKFPKLYNLHLDMIEDKKKVAKIIPKVPDWHKTLPPKEEVSNLVKEVKKEPVKAERVEPSGKPQPIASKTIIAKKNAPKEETEEELTEVEETEEAESVEELSEEAESVDELSVKSEEKEDSESEDEEDSEDETDEDSEVEEEMEERKSKVDENPKSAERTAESSAEEEDDPESFLREKRVEKSKVNQRSPKVKEISEDKIPEGYEENLTEEEKEAREKAKILRKWKFLKYRLSKVDPKKAEAMPDFNDLDDIKIVSKRYEDEIYELKIISNTERYRRMLLSGFMGVEAIVKRLGFDFMNGYTKFQFGIMNEYDSILMEMGESNQDSFFANSSPEVKLLGTVAFTTFAFAAGKYANAPIAKMLGLTTGYESQKSSDGISPPEKVHLD